MASSLKIENLFSVEGRVALITGGGVGGLGALMAEGLVANGAKVHLVGRKEDHIERGGFKTRQDISGKSTFARDITVQEDIDKLVKFVEQHEESLDLLVNNAGLTAYGPPASHLDPLDKLQTNLKEPSLETWKACLATNAWATYTLTVSFLHLLARATEKGGGRGSVVFITGSLTQSWNPYFNFAGCISTRVGMEHIARILANKLSSRRIRVNVVAPGIFPSVGTRPDDPKGLAYPSRVQQIVPFKRAGSPEELIGTIIYLASAASGYMTGERIAIDGGFGLISNGTDNFLPDGAV